MAIEINAFKGIKATVEYEDAIYDSIKGLDGDKLYLMPAVPEVVGYPFLDRLSKMFRKLREIELGTNQEFNNDLAALIYSLDKLKCYY